MLEVSDLELRFGGLTAIDQVSFLVGDDEVCGLIGPNGAGKTSAFNCITRVYKQSSGSITFDGTDLGHKRRHEIVGLGIARTFQNLALFPSRTVMENTVVGAQSRDTPHLMPSLVGWPSTRLEQRRIEADAWELLKLLDLAEIAYRPAAGLPFGTLKRVELARAVISRPKLLLLDEPAGGLTHAEVNELGQLIVKLHHELRFAVLLVEHHMGLVMGICNHVVALDAGRTIADGTPTEVREDPAVIEAYLGRAA